METTIHKYKVSIIIPIYNAALYLRRCAKSLFEQTLEGVEFIFVDDYSTDQSLEILRQTMGEYPNKKQYVKIVQHERNQGSATARNSGLAVASGTYIGWTDADDYLDVDMFRTLYKAAESKSADMVWCNFYRVYESSQIEDRQIVDADAKAIAKGLIRGEIQGMLWNKLIRTDLINKNQIKFLDGYDMAEDRTFLFKALNHCRTVSYVKEPLYYYIQSSTGSLTRDTRAERIYEEIHNAKDIINYWASNDMDWISQSDIDSFKFKVKTRLLYSTSMEDFINWRNIFSESNHLTGTYELSLRHRILALCAKYNLWIVIRGWIFFKMRIGKPLN